MSSADRVPFILNERYVSVDLNTQQNLWSRWLTDSMAFRNAYVAPAVSSSAVGTGALMQVVLGGLELSANGASVDVAPGVLVQNSPIAPVTDDPITAMAMGFNLATTTLATSAPVSDTWYLVQAQVQDVPDPTVSVDVFNGTIFVATPGQVKRRRRTLSFNIKAGTATSVPVQDAGWLPIAGLFRPAGGGAVANNHIVDVRPMFSRPVGTPHEIVSNTYRTDPIGNTTATNLIVSVRASSPHGEMSFVPSTAAPTAFAPDAVAWKATGSAALAADTWWYLYLCPVALGGLPGIRPRHLYANYTGEGMLVLSDVSPRAYLRDNSAAITLPPPFAAHTAGIGQATLVGAVRRNAANTGWVPMTCLHDKVQFMAKGNAELGGAIPLALFAAIGGVNSLPLGAKAFDVEVNQNVVNATVARLVVQDPTGLVQRTTFLTHDSSVTTSSVFRDVDLTAGQNLEVAAILGGAGTYQATILGFRF